MQQETLDKRVSLKLCLLQTIALRAVAKGETNLIALHVQETMVGNRHAMRIASKVVQGLLGSPKSRDFFRVVY
jgi:hypothetical protein